MNDRVHYTGRTLRQHGIYLQAIYCIKDISLLLPSIAGPEVFILL